MKRLVVFLAVLLLLSLLPSPSWAVVAHTHSDQGVCGSGTHSGNMVSACGGGVLTNTFTYTASATNEAVLFAVGCAGSTQTTVTLSATGWTTTALSAVTGSNGGWIASFGAIAPNTTQATFTVTWSNDCGAFMNDLQDEFSGNDTTGGTTTFDAHNQGTGSGNCSITVTPANNNDGLWGACNDSVTAVGGGFTKGADDTAQDWGEWKILSGGSGVGQTVNFTGSGTWDEVGATIKPSGGAATTGTIVLGGSTVIGSTKVM
jgi:hypothetical protein